MPEKRLVGPPSPIGVRLRAARKEAGIKVNELTRLAGVGQGVITRIEGGRTQNVEAETVQKLAAALGLALNWLMKGEGPPKASAVPSYVVEYIDRYETRPPAAEAARRGGVSEEAIERVLFDKLQSDEDPGFFYWLDEMRQVDRRLALERAKPAEQVDRERAADTDELRAVEARMMEAREKKMAEARAKREAEGRK